MDLVLAHPSLVKMVDLNQFKFLLDSFFLLFYTAEVICLIRSLFKKWTKRERERERQR